MADVGVLFSSGYSAIIRRSWRTLSRRKRRFGVNVFLMRAGRCAKNFSASAEATPAAVCQNKVLATGLVSL
jgi:hypothetical protein